MQEKNINAVYAGDDGDFCDQLNAFLTSTLNVELVYTRLKGIRRISLVNSEGDME